MNKVQLVGRLSKDVDSRQAGETTIARFTVACDRRFKKDGQDSADFISCVAFGKTAEFVSKYFKKGNRIGLTGRIQTGSYTKQDGTKVYTTDVMVEDVEFVESKASSQQNQAPQMNRQAPPTQTPQQTPPPAQQYQQTAQQPWMQIPPGAVDDMPFN